MFRERIVVESQRKARVSMAQQPIEVFFSYSRADKRLRDQLDVHLSSLKRRGVISSWHDRQIEAGSEWEEEIDRHMQTADIILLLISPDFVASDYCHEIELPIAMARHEAEDACVVPILLRPVAEWKRLSFAKLQVYPSGAVPITQWADQDTAFVDVVEGIAVAVEKLLGKREKLQRKRDEQEAEEFFYRGLRSDDPQSAIAYYDQAIKLMPNHIPNYANAFNNRGTHRRALGDYEGAIADFDQAIKLMLPRRVDALLNRGLAYLDLNDHQRAIVDYDLAIKLKPNYANAFYSRGDYHQRLGNNKWAIHDYNLAAIFKPDDADTLKKRGICYHGIGEAIKAIADFQEAAVLFQKQGRTDDYQDALNRLKELQS
jgi:Tfp pilus assembly protein PilF